MLGQTSRRPIGIGSKLRRYELIAYDTGQVVAAARAVTSVQTGRFGIITPTNTIHGPSDERPSLGRTTSKGTDVSTIEIENATKTSKTIPSPTRVDAGTTSYRLNANSATAARTVMS